VLQVLRHFNVNLVETVDHTMCDNTDAIFAALLASFPKAGLPRGAVGSCFAHMVLGMFYTFVTFHDTH
jgi:hypothetical protein